MLPLNSRADLEKHIFRSITINSPVHTKCGGQTNLMIDYINQEDATTYNGRSLSPVAHSG